MFGAFTGAMIILIGTTVFSWQLGAFGNQVPQLDTPPGTCMNWPKEDTSAMSKVSCEQDHLFEVAGTQDLAADHDRRAAFPDKDQWKQLVNKKCTEMSVQYLAGKLDPEGRYSVGAILPSEPNWKLGDRALRCGIQVASSSGKLYPTKDSAKTQDQSNVHPTGVCLGIALNFTDIVDCAQPHSAEVIGTIDLGAQFPDFAPAEQQDNKLNQLCNDLAKAYAPGLDISGNKLTVYWDNRKEESWKAGSKKVDCKIGAKDEVGIVPVVGSVKGQFSKQQQPGG